MKTALSSFFFLLLFSHSTFAISIDNIIGCYQTLTIDGKEVEQGPRPELSQSEIFTTENQFFRDLETKRPLETLVLSFYRGHNGPYHSFSNAVAMIDQGEWKETDKTIEHFFDFDILYRNKYYQMVKIDHQVNFSIEEKENGELHGRITYNSDTRNIGDSFTFKLAKAECL